MIWRSLKNRPLTVFYGIVFLIALVSTAWVCDDAYITMRTVDNFIDGYGLTWNPIERVQAYTHPLWMLLLSGVYAVVDHAYLTLILLSALCSIAAVFLVAICHFQDDLQAALFLALACASMAFIEYATSGLENPLSYLLLSLFSWLYLERKLDQGPQGLLILALFSALAALTRLDLVLFFVPALLTGLLRGWQKNLTSILKAVMLGFSPLLLWEGFSLVYYGFLVPNTAYAKLNTGVPQSMLLAQGWLYILDVLHWDPLTIIAAISGAGIAMRSGRDRERALGLGVLLYLGFIVWVGGDFMRGRFFAVPFLVGAILLVRWLAHAPLRVRWTLLGIISVFGLASAIFRPIMMENEPLIAETGIADERGFYFWATGLINNDLSGGIVPVYPWVFEGIELRESLVKVSVQDTIGFRGFFAGPGVHIVDRLALSDPLLARLPIPDPTDWRIGHFRREIPVGYVPSLPDRDIHILDADLKVYYGHIRLITRGRLLDPVRLKTILWMNLGMYEMLIDRHAGR